MAERSAADRVVQHSPGTALGDALTEGDELYAGRWKEGLLVILDLDSAGLDAVRVLDDVKGRDHVRLVPVVCLGGLGDEASVAELYAHRANCVVQRPGTAQALRGTLGEVLDFMVRVVRLP